MPRKGDELKALFFDLKPKEDDEKLDEIINKYKNMKNLNHVDSWAMQQKKPNFVTRKQSNMEIEGEYRNQNNTSGNGINTEANDGSRGPKDGEDIEKKRNEK